MTSHIAYWLATLYLNINTKKILTWLNSFSTIDQLFNASSEELQAANVAEKYITKFKQLDWKSIEADLTWATQVNQHIITYEDPCYPALLKEIVDPPLVLFVKGNVSALNEVQLAVVGSRQASSGGLRNAEDFAYYLAERGLVITSGLALGIDGAAHRGALNAKGMTIGVAGTGLDILYPSAHRPLVATILDSNGALISELPRTMGPFPANFPKRNRIIAGLSVGVLVVEAAMQSGSLITARLAIEGGREVFAIPGSIHQPQARGCHYLIKQGAKLVETAQDILEEIGSLKDAVPPQNQDSESLADLDPASRHILSQIGYEITAMDVILLRGGLTAGEVSSMLLTLELNGYIQSVPGGYLRIRSKK